MGTADIGHGTANKGGTESRKKLSRSVANRVVYPGGDREVKRPPKRAHGDHQHKGYCPHGEDRRDTVTGRHGHSEGLAAREREPK